ncbi:MAG: HEAT repeat domain-containing protein [Nitrososphaerales archaeon]
MKYTERIVGEDIDHEYEILGKMEEKYEERDVSYFNKVLKDEPSLVVRVHAVTVLSEIGDESSVPVLAGVMKNDPSSLIRHECAFSLGQMGLKSAIPYLCDSTLNDPSEIVRHESAAALGSIGDESARKVLVKASKDESEEVRGSAIASLFNLDFIEHSATKKSWNVDSVSMQVARAKSEKKKKKMPHP